MGIIIKPIVTEKMTVLGDKLNRYGFIVDRAANKIEIKKAVEEIFGVKVAKVNTMNVPGKAKRLGAARPGRTKDWKKAIVQLTADSKTIEFFEGMV